MLAFDACCVCWAVTYLGAFAGRTKKMKVGRTAFDSRGQRANVDEVLAIDIKPGWKSGTKVTFQGKGNQPGPGQPAEDVQFVIKETRHMRFVREGNDLIHVAKISLKEALLGGAVSVRHLDGTAVPVQFQGPINPSTPLVVRCALATTTRGNGA